MADLVKNVLGGGWSLIIGWILPVFLTLQLLAYLVLGELRLGEQVKNFSDQSTTYQQTVILSIAAITGLVLAASQAPLYRILEGYLFWPKRLAQSRTAKHRGRRDSLVAQHEGIATTQRGVESGLVYEKAARYPAAARQFAPTSFGNAIRRFETYAGDRYKLDSQLLWHNLSAAAPDRVVSAVTNARTNVDIFVCFVYGGMLTVICGIAGLTRTGITEHSLSTRSLLAVCLGALISILSYRLAVLGTDEWDAAVRALVDHGRTGVAVAFGLTIPRDLEEERAMWRAVNTLVRRPYTYSSEKEVPSILSRYRDNRDAHTGTR